MPDPVSMNDRLRSRRAQTHPLGTVEDINRSVRTAAGRAAPEARSTIPEDDLAALARLKDDDIVRYYELSADVRVEVQRYIDAQNEPRVRHEPSRRERHR